jgi:hypothetical protein
MRLQENPFAISIWIDAHPSLLSIVFSLHARDEFD